MRVSMEPSFQKLILEGYGSANNGYRLVCQLYIHKENILVLTCVVYCICANTTLHDETYTLNYISLYHVATFEGNFFEL